MHQLSSAVIFFVQGILLHHAPFWCGFYTFPSGEIRWVPVLCVEIGNNPLILGTCRARNDFYSQCRIGLLKAALNGIHLDINSVDGYNMKIFVLMSKKCYVAYRVYQNKQTSLELKKVIYIIDIRRTNYTI